MVIIIGHVPYSMLNKLTFHRVSEVTTVLHQAHPAVALHVVVSVPQYGAVSLLILFVIFSFTASLVWFVKEQLFIKIAPREES